ncbi:cytochrome c oxidase subunit 3 [Marinicauda salina]|uniref:Probable cytochrome c oxidase subunit 3 n=1 Tax=Marinicauda salina TaxID=2135793 RepID=A0A2U2BUI9_9PROT|nr:cytochrome c oxidase subunit 3 [Marinicauda salina]PWE17657.1 cytochrome c oxidase subunit 3 [Marinicauda salina]
MAGGAVKHDYHLVDPSPWPFVGSVGAFVLAFGLVVFMKGLSGGDGALGAILGQGSPYVLILGGLIVAYTMIGWWGDVIKEANQGDHTPVVDIGLRYGMILFILSEVMFFVAWFWVFFEAALFHEARAGASWTGEAIGVDFSGWETWPPPGIETFDPFHLPLINTMILLLSGTTVTWAHHALQHGDRKGAKLGLLITILLGVTFSCVQAYEYAHAHFSFGGNLYGASFFMATGFHGAHVIIGTIFLTVCLLRLLAGGFTPQKHFGFEAAAWYWHFVDVVWLFLFAFVYVAFAGPGH